MHEDYEDFKEFLDSAQIDVQTLPIRFPILLPRKIKWHALHEHAAQPTPELFLADINPD